MTFNMQFGQAWDPVDPCAAPVVLEDTIAFLQANPHDVIFLQEVEQAQHGGVQPWPPPNFMRIKEELGEYHSVFAYPKVNPDELPFGIALAILSRTPLVDFLTYDLPPAPVMFEFEGRMKSPSYRQLIQASTTIAGRPLQLLNAHLQAFFMINSSSNAHREQRDLVEKALRETAGPTLLAGDFNSAPDEDVVGQYGSAGFRTAQDSEITWRLRPYVTDHLFYNAGVKVEAVDVIHTLCSDHHAVSANFRFAQ